MYIFNPKTVCARLLELRTPETIKELCDKLCEFLFAGKQLEPKSRSNKLAPYSKLLRGVSNLVVGENAYIQIRQNGEEWVRHLYFRYCGLEQTDWRDINAKATAKVIDKLQHQEAIDANKFEETIAQLLNSSKEVDIGAGLFASGRRPREIFLQGVFEAKDSGIRFVSGQAKKRGNEKEYIFPLVGCTPELWLAKLAEFRDGKICKNAHSVQQKKGLSPDSEAYKDSFTKLVRNHVDRKGIKPAFSWLSKESVSCSRLRDAYLSVAALRHKPSGVYELFYQAEIVGHKIEEAVASMPTLNYQRFYIEEEKQCSEPLNYSQELAGSGSDLSQLADLNLQEPAKSQNQPEGFTPAIGPILQSSQTSEISKLRPDNLIALSEEVPVRICPAVANAPDSTESNQAFGGKCSESSTIAITHIKEKSPNDSVSVHTPNQNIDAIIQASRSLVNGRHPNDLYDTPWWLVLLIIAYTPLSGVIGECCVGNGPIASALAMAGLTVWTNDIDTQKPANYHVNACDVNEWKDLPLANWIVTNPPYSDKSAPIIQAAYNHAKRGIVMLLRQDWDEGCSDRLAFLKAHPPTTKIIVPRYCFRKGKNGKWATDDDPVCIYVWDKQAKMQGLTHPIWLGAEDIPLYHRTPDSAPAIELVEAEVKRIIEAKEVAEKATELDVYQKKSEQEINDIMQAFIEYNKSLPRYRRWFISISIVEKCCQPIRRETAAKWHSENSSIVSRMNQGLSLVHNRLRQFDWEYEGGKNEE